MRALEERLLNAGVRSDSEAVSELLADEFEECGSSGRVYDKKELVEELRTEPPDKIWPGNFRRESYRQVARW